MIYKQFVKALLDKLFALVAFFILFPIFFVLTLLLIIANQGKPYFTQKRVGKNNKIFTIFKFKTMTDQHDKNGNLLPDEKRLTWIGKIVRKTSLDEIPQLINVLNGDMSLIGPRPLLVEYLPLYNDFQKKRHLLKPGITGWTQVNGRNNNSWQQKFEYDVWYVENCSFILDVKIFFMTFVKLFKSKDVNQSGEATTTFFTGNYEN